MGRIRASNAWEDRETAVKERLRSYRYLVIDYANCMKYYQDLFELVTPGFQETKIQSCRQDAVEEKLINHIDLRSIMAADLEKKRLEIESTLQLIESLPGNEKIVIQAKYVHNKKMADISREYYISIAQCWRYYMRAIRRLAESLKLPKDDSE